MPSDADAQGQRPSEPTPTSSEAAIPDGSTPVLVAGLVIGLCALVTTLLVPLQPANADGHGNFDAGTDGGWEAVFDEPSEPATTDPVSGNPDGPVVERVRVRVYSAQDDGTACEAWINVIVPDTISAQDLASRYNTAFFLAYDRNTTREFTGACPVELGDAVPPVSDADVMQAFAGQVDRPDPRIAPGFMLTGMTAYLETQRPPVYEETVTAGPPGNQVALEARGRLSYRVDWGDGTVTGPHTDVGGPYPNGIVTHVYDDKGVVDVQVIDTFELQWRFPGGNWSAPLTLELAPVTLGDFEVREYRAVRVNG